MGEDKDVTTTHMDRQTVETDRFRSFVRATYPDLKLYALRRVGPAGAEDVVSETYVVAWRKWVDPPPTDPRPWLFGIARNIVRNEVRRHRRAERFARTLRHGRRSAPEPATTHCGSRSQLSPWTTRRSCG